MDILLSMKIFRRVAETGNFSEVAREMSFSQPTISKHIAALEKHLDVKLLNRSTRQMSLTDTGKQYYDRCAYLLDELAETESTLRNQQSQPAGILRINTPITYGERRILPYLWKFLEKYPELKIDMIMDDHYIDLVKEGVDMAVRVGPMTDSSLIARKIGDSPRVTIASSEYIEKHGAPDDLSDLKNHNCIVYTLLTTCDEWHFSGADGPQTIRVSGRFSVNNPNAIRQAVLAGQGIAVTPIWLVDDCIESGKVKVILNDYTPTPLDIHAVYPDRQFVPAKIQVFIQYLKAIKIR